MSDWQPIETAPKDGTVIILSTDYTRAGHDRVRCGYWLFARSHRWIMKDENTQVRDGWTDNSRWQLFISEDSGSMEYSDVDEQTFVRDFDPTHWMPLPSPPQ